jgi:vancomycin resistance protein YoaR
VRKLAFGAAGLAALGLALALLFTLDQRSHTGRVARNVVLQSRSIGGMDRSSLEREVNRLAEEAKQAELIVRASGGAGEADVFRTDASEISLTVDPARTMAAVMRSGRQANLATRFASWLLSPLRPRDAGVAVSADHDAVYRLVEERDEGRQPPVEPTIRGDESGVEVVPGRPGRGVDAADVIAALPQAAREGFPLSVAVTRGEVAPRHSLAEAREVAQRARTWTAEPVKVVVSSQTREIPMSELREWLGTAGGDGALRPVFDEAKAKEDLAERFAGLGREPTDARFVVDGGVRLVAGREGTRCCSADAVDLIEQAVLKDGGPSRPIGPLPMDSVEPERTVEEARKLKIVEQVGIFSTPHKAGEPRVKNIHRIADLMRGTLIEPGGTISINDIVGKRTVEKGFVAAPEIQDGNFSEGVGGGISQFATTLFNAAFFAGLEFPEYQSHSIYISRYPYGREATLSFPKPDLKIRNPTPYGVLIWTSYTDTSISVSLWSTKHFEATQSGQTQSPRGPCTFVRTERTRKAPDGTINVDRVNALYRPKEGVQC